MGTMEMKVEVWFDELIECYTVEVNGETLLECLSEDDVKALTLGEIKNLMDEID